MSQSSPSSSNPLKHSQFSEYQILYSTSLTQKSKVYHDGRCKFFKFNKKLIIYNEHNIVISTHFLNNSKVLDVQEKEIKIDDDILIIIEEKLGDYERDISNLFNSKSDNRNDKIINKRISTRTPEKENAVSTRTVLRKPRRVGMSKISSTRYASTPGFTTPLKQQGQQRTPVSKDSVVTKSFASVSSDRINHLSTLKRQIEVDLPSPLTPLRGLKVKSISSLLHDEQTPTHNKRSKIDVYASDDDDGNISEDISDLEVGPDEETSTQTKTYNFTTMVARNNKK